jgi:type IV pilus assembly protein PilB
MAETNQKNNPKIDERERARRPVRKPTAEEKEFFDKRTLAKKYKGTPTLGLILEEAGLVNEEMIKDVLRNSDESAQSLKRSLIQQGLVRESDILDALAQEMGMEKIDFHDLRITPELVQQIDPKTAKKYQVFPVRYDDETIHVALSDPLNIQTTDDLEKILGKKVIGVVAPEDEIQKAIKRYYEGNEVTELYEGFADQAEEEVSPFRSYEEVDLNVTEVEQPPVVKFVDLIFKQAVHDRASDIHVEPQRQGVVIRFRRMLLFPG